MQHKNFLPKVGYMKLILSFLLLFSTVAFADPFTAVTQSTVSVTTSSAQFLPANEVRTYLLILNNGSASVILKLGSTISGSESVIIPAGGNYEPRLAPKQSVWMKSSSGTQSVNILEGI